MNEETPALSPRQHPRPMRYNSPQPPKAALGPPEAAHAGDARSEETA